jgi:SAM-dependent MidA family methyltransferase
MTALKARLARLIAEAGPISVSDYMAACLFDPEHGYYSTREPFGAGGDFITAPEISQMFGELVGVWAYSAWQAIGCPAQATLAEIGPGRGTLMADMLRTVRRIDKAFLSRVDIAMIETSPRLAGLQRERLAAETAKAAWLRTVEELPEAPLVIVGNELFDAIPVRQYVKTESGWRERMVALDEAGGLRFVAGAGGLEPALLPDGADDVPMGTMFETAPAREALMDAVAARIARHGGAALFIDYGHTTAGFGDTLQAMRDHAFDDPLASPGEADLTSHVDFSALAAVCRGHGLVPRTTTQGAFLLDMGLIERAGALGQRADAQTRERLHGEVERLAGPDAMGNLFKVLIVAAAGIALPPFDAAD